jgi:cytochrome c553
LRANSFVWGQSSTTDHATQSSRRDTVLVGAILSAMLAASMDPTIAEEQHPLRAEANLKVDTIDGLTADTAYGAYLAGDCVACHRPSAGAGIPPIAGLPARHIINALVEYKLGIRANEVMVVRTSRLGDEEIAALAAHFSAQNP